ncbi:MAG TPA: cysteine synthase family protein [Ignavibacteriales bacterium]|nr:cysteine synthase family protein [Ignavibacteriales bacterium]
MDVKDSVLELVGSTPLVRIKKLSKGLKPQILAKVEFFNPGGSIKDRIGLALIEDAEARGIISPGGTVVEATSGNTGIGLALAATVKGYKSIFVMTDKVCCEKSNYLKALGAEVIIVRDGYERDDPNHYVNVAKRIARTTPNAIYINQYSNTANPETHYRTTGPEIWRQTEGRVTHFVAAVGTGGTISGVGKFLKEKNPEIKIIAADPVGSIFKDYFDHGMRTGSAPYLVEAIGQNYIPENVKFQYIDEVFNVTDHDSFEAARRLTRQEGIFCGGSTGTIFHTVLKIAEKLDENAVIVFPVCDTGERYLTKFHNDDWLKEKLNSVQDRETALSGI